LCQLFFHLISFLVHLQGIMSVPRTLVMMNILHSANEKKFKQL